MDGGIKITRPAGQQDFCTGALDDGSGVRYTAIFAGKRCVEITLFKPGGEVAAE